MTALAGAVWLSLAGFYVVKNAIALDVETGVGQVLAAPLSPFAAARLTLPQGQGSRIGGHERHH